LLPTGSRGHSEPLCEQEENFRLWIPLSVNLALSWTFSFPFLIKFLWKIREFIPNLDPQPQFPHLLVENQTSGSKEMLALLADVLFL